MTCPFCEIEKQRTRIIEEGNLTYVFLSNPRLMPGHTLIIPKRHVVKPSELNSEEAKEVWEKICKYQEKIIANISEGCDLRENFRPFQKDGYIKQSHLHFHLLPRNNRDELYNRCQIYETNIFSELQPEEMETILKKIRR